MNLMHTLGSPRGSIREKRGAPKRRTIRVRRGTVTKRGKAASRGRRGTAKIRGAVIKRRRRGTALIMGVSDEENKKGGIN